MVFFKVKGKTQNPTDVHKRTFRISQQKMYTVYITIQLEITIIYIQTDEVCGIYFFLSDCTTKNMAKLLPTQRSPPVTPPPSEDRTR